MEKKSKNKCAFCGADATKIDRLFVGTRSEEKDEFVKWDYYGTPIYTCDNHSIKKNRYSLDGEILDAKFF